jgi:hypothetical protein
VSAPRTRPLRARWRSLALDPEGTLSLRARLAACVYAEHSTDDDGRLRYPPSALTLADAMGCSDRTARRARQELVRAGFLVLDERAGHAPDVRLALPTPAHLSGGTPDTTPAKSAPETEGLEVLTSGGALARRATDHSRGEEEGADARRLVAGYVNRLRSNGSPVPKRLVGQVAKQVGELVRDEVPAETIERALALLLERRLNPSTLPSLVPEAATGPRGETSDFDWEAFDGYDKA